MRVLGETRKTKARMLATRRDRDEVQGGDTLWLTVAGVQYSPMEFVNSADTNEGQCLRMPSKSSRE